MDSHCVGQGERPFNAASIGQEFVKDYFSVLHQSAELAWRYYAKHGQFSTVYSDGTTVVAKNPEELNLKLMRHVTPATEAILVTSVLSVYDMPIRLLVQATGNRFAQSFVVDYQPTQRRPFTILTSIVAYTTAEAIRQANAPIAPHTGTTRNPADAAADRHCPVVTVQNRIQMNCDGTAPGLPPPKPSMVQTVRRRVNVADSNVDAVDRIPSGTTAGLVLPLKNAIDRGVHSADDAAGTDRVPSATTAERRPLKGILKRGIHVAADGNAANRIPPETTAGRSPPSTIKKRVRFADDIPAERMPSDTAAERAPCVSVMKRRGSHSGDVYAGRDIPAADSSNLFVGRLPKAISSQNLSDMFAIYGQVMSARVNEGIGQNGAPTKYNYGFVKYDRPASARNALAHRPIRLVNGHVLNLQLGSA